VEYRPLSAIHDVTIVITTGATWSYSVSNIMKMGCFFRVIFNMFRVTCAVFVWRVLGLWSVVHIRVGLIR
jgi:hypothetical protein